MSGSTQCPHSDLHFHLNNSGFGDTNLHYLEIKASCKVCDKPMVFRCNAFGVLPDQPTVSIDRTEIVLPFMAEGEELVGAPLGYTVTLEV